MMLVLSSFVFAVSSEISSEFFVDVTDKPVVNYVPPEKSAGDYLGYFALVFVALVFVYFISKKVSAKKVSVKKVVVKKVSAKRKSSKRAKK